MRPMKTALTGITGSVARQVSRLFYMHLVSILLKLDYVTWFPD